MSIKMFGLKDLVNFLLQETERLSSCLRSLLTHMQNFYLEVESFTKMEVNLVG